MNVAGIFMTQIENTSFDKDPLEIELKSAQRALTYAEAGMHEERPILFRTLQSRHDLFPMNESDFDDNLPLEDQLYEDPFYNDAFYVKDLRVRTGSEYHKEKESYDPVINSVDADGNPTPEKDDTPETLLVKKQFRQVILKAAQELGYVSNYIGVSDDETERRLNILPSTIEKIDKPVQASIIFGAAGISNLIRVQDAFRNIKSGAVQTDTIIFAAGERTAAPHELAAVEKLGYRPGATEFEQAVNALEDIGNVQFSDETEKVPAEYGVDTPDTSVRRGEVVINDKIVTVLVVEGSYDRDRKDIMSGKPANRSITSETLRAVIQFLPKEEGLVQLTSHDGWGKGQEIIGHEILGLEANKEISASWAYKSDRVYVDENGQPDILAAQAILDEMAKSYFNLVRLKIAALNKIESIKTARLQR